MKVWGIVFWICVGGLLEWLSLLGGRHHGWPWFVLLLVAALGWSWSALISGARSLLRQSFAVMTGRAVALPRTDPQALAEEVAALNAQLVQLRDTATSFDVSFDQTLERMDERLRRVEQQSPYIRIKPGS